MGSPRRATALEPRPASGGPGVTIAICGIDGAGKTTLARQAVRALQAGSFGPAVDAVYHKLLDSGSHVVRFYKHLMEVDPDFTGENQTYVFAAERVRTICDDLSTLRAGHDVCIVDRHLYCDLAYATARGWGVRALEFALDYAGAPDLTFFLDAPVDVALARIRDRGQPIWEYQENERVLSGARAAYGDLARRHGLIRLDATAPTTELARIVAEAAYEAARTRAVT